jgi:hypothetical protein
MKKSSDKKFLLPNLSSSTSEEQITALFEKNQRGAGGGIPA